MKKNKSSISEARSYKEISQFWDTNNLGEYWEKTEPAEFGVDIQTESTYFPVEMALSAKVCKIARQKGVSPETLLNLWVQERVGKERLPR